MESDRAGGGFLGGYFSDLDGTPRPRLARIDRSGQLTSWLPVLSGDNDIGWVTALHVFDNALYVASVQPLVGTSIDAFDITNGVQLPFHVTVSGWVYALSRSGNVIYIAGDFSSVAGARRANLAAVNASTGAVRAWNPLADIRRPPVTRTLITSGSTVYTAGATGAIAFEGSGDGNALPEWPPSGCSLNGPARIADGTYYALTPTRLERVDLTTGACSPLVLSGTGEGLDLLIHDGVATVARLNGSVSAQNIELASGQVVAEVRSNIPDRPNRGGHLIEIGDKVGLELDPGESGLRAPISIGVVQRNHLAAVDEAGRLTDWTASADGRVTALERLGDDLLIGGQFVTVNDADVPYLARLNPQTGELVGTVPRPNDVVEDIEVSGRTAFVVGRFTAVDGTPRNRGAALTASTGALLPWDPDADGTIRTVESASAVIYLGGPFTHIGDFSRSGLAAVDRTRGSPTSWGPEVDDLVRSIVREGSTVYLAGTFSQVGNRARSDLAAVDAATGTVLPWNPSVTGDVFTLEADPDTVYVGGDFTR